MLQMIRKVERKHHAEFLCSCGAIFVSYVHNVYSGHTKSCGCLTRSRRTSKDPAYKVWQQMTSRCRNPKATGYANYGGRGITVCARWQKSFAAFLDDVGPRPSMKHTLDRINNDGNYEPDNVRWATQQQQVENSRIIRILSFNGKKQSISAWARELGLKPNTVIHRLRKGWPVARALGEVE